MLLFAYVLACVVLAVGYAGLLWVVRRVWCALPEQQVPAHLQPTVPISVVVAARNEASCIEACLRSVLAGDYPAALREVIVVDDYSEDDTAARVALLAAEAPGSVRLLRLCEATPPAPPGKKSALQWGITHARGELIATTDADCTAPPRWLSLLALAYTTHRPNAVVAPVVLDVRPRCWWDSFQALDTAATMAITGVALARGWFAAGNGANLCYPKAVFEAVGGYAGSEHRASGDDMYLLAKMPLQQVLFLKNAAAAVRTRPCSDVRAFWAQRLRWGTKNAAWPNRRLQGTLALVLALHTTLLANALLAFWKPLLGVVALFQLGAKAGADHALLREMSRFFHQKNILRHFWPSLLAHVVYVAIVGWAALVVRRYTWKGRRCS